MATWVVFEARSHGQQMVWAWGLNTGGSGFDRVEFTDTTGVDPVELDVIPELTRYLFSVEALEAGPQHQVDSRRRLELQ